MAEDALACTICGKTKPASQFKVRKGKPTKQCKECINAQARIDSKRAAAMERTRGRAKYWVDNNPEGYADKKQADSERRRHKRGK